MLLGMNARLKPPAWRLFAAVCPSLFVSLAAGGCDSSDPTLGKVVTFSGRVLVDGEPLNGQKGAVTFIPDKAKGNTAAVQPTGSLDDDGNYTLYYAQGKKGAPLGWHVAGGIISDE